jgi:type II secretory pathway component PulF
MKFTYTGIDNSGAKKTGHIDANTEREVIEYLRGSSITPISIKKSDQASAILFKKVKSTEIILFTRQLSSMTLTGLTLIESLKILKPGRIF